MSSNIFKKAAKKIVTEYNYLSYKPQPVIFDHIPKCAGTTINKMLYQYYPNKFIYRVGAKIERVNSFKNLSVEKRKKYKFINGHFAHFLVEDVGSHFNTIVIFREPIDRIVSHYYYIKRSKKHPLHKRVFIERQISLKDYCSEVDSIELSNFYVRRYSAFSKDDAEKFPEESIKLAYNNIIKRYDLIGFQEDLSTFIKKLSVILNIPVWLSEERVANKTLERKTVDEIDKSTIHAISSYNMLDLKLYDMLREKVMNS